MNAASLAFLGYTSDASATTVTGMGTIGCAAGYGEAESPYAICEGGAFSFHGCVLGCTASSPAFLDGVDTAAADLPVEQADAAATGIDSCLSSHVKSGTTALTVSCGSDGEYTKDAGDVACTPCTAVANAAPGATYTCTTASDSRVSDCAAGFTHTVGATGAHDTCAANTCTAMDTASMAALGYTAATDATATTVAGLGTIGCAAGYARADAGVVPWQLAPRAPPPMRINLRARRRAHCARSRLSDQRPLSEQRVAPRHRSPHAPPNRIRLIARRRARAHGTRTRMSGAL